jgi:hypothetical protein
MSENLPKVGLRLVMKRIYNGKKTPKYGLCGWSGDRAEMQFWHDNFTGRDGICGYLKNNISSKSNAPEMNFELKNGFNLTGLKQWWTEGRVSGFAYGEPDTRKDVGNKHTRANPFYPSRTDDCFLFRSNPSKSDASNTLPDELEIIVLKGRGASKQGRMYLSILRNGGFELPSTKEYRADEFSNI